MPRVPVVIVLALALLTLVVIVPRSTLAQDATAVPVTTHPFVGAWIVDTDTTIDGNFPALAVATSDGTYLESHPEVGVGVGSWQATGDRAVTLTIVFRAPGETGAPIGLTTAHATIELTETGDEWQAPYTYEVVGPDGSVLLAGEGHARATRVGIDTRAGMATPAATPAS